MNVNNNEIREETFDRELPLRIDEKLSELGAMEEMKKKSEVVIESQDEIIQRQKWQIKPSRQVRLL